MSNVDSAQSMAVLIKRLRGFVADEREYVSGQSADFLEEVADALEETVARSEANNKQLEQAAHVIRELRQKVQESRAAVFQEVRERMVEFPDGLPDERSYLFPEDNLPELLTDNAALVITVDDFERLATRQGPDEKT